MANKYVLREGSSGQIRFGVNASISFSDDGNDYSAASGRTEVALTLSALANGAGRQSDKFTFGSTWARDYRVDAAFDWTGETPSATGYVEVWMLPSGSSTQGNANVAANSGADAAAPDGALGSITLTEFKRQGIHVGNFRCHDGAVVQSGNVRDFFRPSGSYNQLLIVNSSGDAFEASNANMAVWFTPIEDIDAAA